MIDLTRYKEACRVLPDDVMAAEVNADRADCLSVQVEKGQIRSGTSFSRTKLYARVTTSATGQAYSEDLAEDPAALFARAETAAAYASAAEPFREGGTEQLESAGKPAAAADLCAAGSAIEQALDRQAEILQLNVSEHRLASATVNSFRLDVSAVHSHASADVTIALKNRYRDAVVQIHTSAETPAGLNPDQIAADLLDRAVRYDGGGLPAVSVSPGRLSAVLSAGVMCNLLMTAWQTLSGEAMRNGQSYLRDETGLHIGSQHVRFVNAPFYAGAGQRYLLDSEGVPVTKTILVDQGRLVTPLCTLSSGVLSGRPSTGSAGRVPRMTGDVPIRLTTVPAIFCLEPASGSADTLAGLMGDGLLLTYSLDLFHSLNTATGEFSIPCGGILYRGGRPAGFAPSISIAGHLEDLWSAVEAVGSDMAFAEFYFENYLVGSPSVLVKDLCVSG